MIRQMTIEDYEEVYELWCKIQGFALRSIDDSKEGITRFLERNKGNSVVAVLDDKIVGTILCGHDGRQAAFYHVCVDQEYRMRGIGKSMAVRAIQELQKDGISKVSLRAFVSNNGGNAFWNEMGWTKRSDMNSYEFVLNEKNITSFVK